MIKIGGKEYKLKYTLRSLFAYENVTGTAFDPTKVSSEYILLYVILATNNDDFEMTFETFLDHCDSDPLIFVSFRKWFVDVLKQKAILQGDSNETDTDDKKKD